MNKNSILGFVLIFLIVIGYSYFTAPTAEELKKQQNEAAINDSIENAAQKTKDAQAKNLKDKNASAYNNSNSDTLAAIPNDSITNDSVSANNINGPFSKALLGSNHDYIVETELYKIKISSKGGVITYAEVKNYVTADTTPLILFTKQSSSLNLILNDKNIGIHHF